MACWRPLTRHCLGQGWPRSMSPYGISRPHWVYLLLTVIIHQSPYANLQQWNIQYLSLYFDTLGPRENDRHFVDDILNVSPWTKFVVFWFEFHWNLFPEDQLPIGQYWVRQLLGAYQATSFYLNHWWLISMTHICATRPQSSNVLTGLCMYMFQTFYYTYKCDYFVRVCIHTWFQSMCVCGCL